MTPAEIRNLITMLMMAAGAVACFAYALTNQRRQAKKPVYAWAGFVFLAGAIIYSFGAFDLYPDSVFRKWLMTGWLSALTFYLLVSIYIAAIIQDWKKNDRR